MAGWRPGVGGGPGSARGRGLSVGVGLSKCGIQLAATQHPPPRGRRTLRRHCGVLGAGGSEGPFCLLGHLQGSQR